MPKIRTKKTRNIKYIPYASGFIPPTKEQQIQAIGCGDIVPPEFNVEPNEEGYQFFKPVPQPTSIDDWLAQYVGKGQTFLQYLSKCSWLSSRKLGGIDQKFVPSGANILEKYPEGKIYLLPIGSFDGKRFIHLDELAKFAEIYLGIPVCTLPGVDIEINIKEKRAYWIDDQFKIVLNGENTSLRFPYELEGRFYNKHNRYQLGIASLLSKIKLNIPDDALCLIGLTMSDLYREDSDLFVAGWAAGGSHVAVFSFFRYDPSLKFSTADWYDLRRNHKMSQKHIQNLTFQRSCKLLVHEIGHLLGIGHCIYFQCCMNGSGHLAEDFRQPLHLCPVDLHKLQTLVGFDVLKRYQNLLEFYNKHGMKDEADWITRRIEFIKTSPIEIA